jgi:galactokinase
MTDQKPTLTENEIAKLAHEAEVIEFSESGGMMDHFSIAYGGMIGIDFKPQIKITRFNTVLDSFVLGNSEEKKQTTKILADLKNVLVNISNTLTNSYKNFSLMKINLNDVDRFKKHLTADEYRLLNGTIRNRDITREAFKELTNEETNKDRVGELLNEQQTILRDILKVSTPKIDRMINAVLNAGAYGAKINGSGGGGCMFAYACENNEKVLEELKKIASESFIVNIDTGVQKEFS